MKTRSLLSHVESALPEDGQNILVAVSGGVDSVVLLHTLCQLRDRYDINLRVAHLNHQIRLESADDAEFVRRLCALWQVPCHIASVAVPVLARKHRQSLEMAGRHARRELFLDLAATHECSLVALAHHRDDQVETFMMRLVRGSGQAGLAAMARCEGVWWRPLLECTRAQVLAYARQQKLEWVEDSSNRDPVYLRNRMRHQVLPLLRELNPAFDERTEGLISQLRVDEDFWQQQVGAQFDSLVLSEKDGLRLDRARLLDLHPALRMRVIREALLRVRGGLTGIEGCHLVAVAGLLVGQRSQAQLDLPGCWVARRYETLWLREFAPHQSPDYNKTLSLPGRIELPGGQWLQSSFAEESRGESPQAVELDISGLRLPLSVRSWQPGDRFQPLGMAGTKKVKNFLGDAKVEFEERQRVVVLADADKILWLVGLRRSVHAVASSDCRRILRLELFSPSHSGTKNL